MNDTFSVIIPGRCYVKKNTAKVFGSRKVYTPQFLGWEKAAMLEIHNEKRKRKWVEPLKGTLALMVSFHFQNKLAEPDLSNLIEGVQDVLEKTKIIENDKQFHLVTMTKHIGHFDGAVVTVAKL